MADALFVVWLLSYFSRSLCLQGSCRLDQELGRGFVGGQGDIVDIADPQQAVISGSWG